LHLPQPSNLSITHLPEQTDYNSTLNYHDRGSMTGGKARHSQ